MPETLDMQQNGNFQQLEITLHIWGSNPLGFNPPPPPQKKNLSNKQITLLWLKIVDIFQKIIDVTLEKKIGNQIGVS